MSELDYALDILKDDLNELHQQQAIRKFAIDRKTYSERKNSLHAAIKILGKVSDLGSDANEQALLIDNIISRLSSLQRVDISKYKSTLNKETLEYYKTDFGRFIEVRTINKFIRDLKKGL